MFIKNLVYIKWQNGKTTGWPDNKEKCTNLFNYCITYVDKHNNTGGPNNNNNNGLKDDDPFVVKVNSSGTAVKLNVQLLF